MHIVYVRDFTMYFSIRNTSLAANKLPRYFLIQLVVTKLCYLLVTFIIPLLVLPFAWWQVLLLYVISQAIAGALLLLVLVVPHINEDAAVAENPAAIKGLDDWALHQIHTTVDSSVNSHVLSWLTGGLNTHLVHHLFPNICHVHYLPLTQIIKQELCNLGITYNEKTFGASIRDHFRYLKLMGVAPS
jgi:linoleoyl-CoA desaturase